MILSQILVSTVLLLTFQCVLAEDIKNNDYMGEKFPVKFLEPEKFTSSMNLLDINALTKTIDYFYGNINFIDVNKGIGAFMTNAILKRTLLDDGFRLSEGQKARVRKIIVQSDSIVSHLVYDDQHVKKLDMLNSDSLRVSQLFREVEQMVYFIKPFNNDKLQKWVRSKGNLNEYLEEIDAATLAKEKYVELVDDSIFTYFIRIEDSECLSRIIYNIPPSPQDTELRPCRRDPYCKKAIHAAPSMSYGLSHRIVNLVFYQALRHCFWVSPRADELHIDILCAYMYRETVYLARRGYFARDMFLEHIAVCGLMGYEQFFRKHWFHKAISWIDNEGCMRENPNFDVNRTVRFMRTGNPDAIEINALRKHLKRKLFNDCHNHPMALLTVVLSHAIRYAAHLLL